MACLYVYVCVPTTKVQKNPFPTHDALLLYFSYVSYYFDLMVSLEGEILY